MGQGAGSRDGAGRFQAPGSAGFDRLVQPPPHPGGQRHGFLLAEALVHDDQVAQGVGLDTTRTLRRVLLQSKHQMMTAASWLVDGPRNQPDAPGSGFFNPSRCMVKAFKW
jgi:hypothetical protein